jgi:hypothetical protein
MPIILTRQGSAAVKLDPTSLKGERELQAYIAANPLCIPMDEIEEGLQLLVLGREFPTASGPVDVLAMDSEGVLYLIETKLYDNPDKRKVVAQVLDYGAALWAAGADNVSSSLKTFVAAAGGSLLERVQEAFDLPEDEAQETLERLSSSIAAGSFRFLVLMDQLHRLKELILFLNENSKFELMAVEVDFYEHQDLKIVIPRLFGAQTRKRIVGAGSPHWSDEAIEKDMDARGMQPEHRRLLEWAFRFAKQLESEGLATTSFGTGRKPSKIVRTTRSSIFKAGVAKSHGGTEADLTLRMRHWKGDPDRIESSLAELSQALGKSVTFEPNRMRVPIVEALVGIHDLTNVEKALRALAREL